MENKKTNETKEMKQAVIKKNALLGVALLVLGGIIYYTINRTVGIFPVIAGAIISALALHGATKLKEEEKKV